MPLEYALIQCDWCPYNRGHLGEHWHENEGKISNPGDSTDKKPTSRRRGVAQGRLPRGPWEGTTLPIASRPENCETIHFWIWSRKNFQTRCWKSQRVRGRSKVYLKPSNLYQGTTDYGLSEERPSQGNKVTIGFASLVLTCPRTR